MNFPYNILIVVIIGVCLPKPGQPAGRRPQAVEQRYCGLMFDKELEMIRTIDSRAIAQAYNIGQNGSLCMTTCRILTRGNVKPMEAVPSPDYIQCAIGPQYCYKGNCIARKEITELMRKDYKLNKTIQIVNVTNDGGFTSAPQM